MRQLEVQDGRNVRKIAAASEVPEEDRVLRVAAYCRVSTDDIDQALSIQLQIQQYMKKIRENPNWKYAGCYVDDGFSGTNTAHRQGFQKLMRDAMDGKIDMIITKAVSRFARNLMDCIGWVEALQNHDPPVRVFFEQENLDTMSQTSGIILFVLAMVAQEESHMKSEAILLSLEWRFSRGRFLTPRLFGYDKKEVPDGFGGYRKKLVKNESEARVVRWMYSTLVNGGSPEEMAAVLTEMAIPTGGRRKNGTLNTHWTADGIKTLMRNEKYCGDVLARKTYTPNYKDHKARRNNGKKNKYFQPDHHDAIVSRAMWNAAQRILNSRKYGHEGTYLPMRIIDRGPLTGYISMNCAWAGYDTDDYYRVSRIAMGLLDETFEEDLETEYMPEGGRRIGALIDDHGITQIARDLTAAEQRIKEEMEGKREEGDSAEDGVTTKNKYQVVSGDMFTHMNEPMMHITGRGITFNRLCLSRLPDTDYIELLFNPVERIIIVRPCGAEHPNAVSWDANYKRAMPLSRIIYETMGWEPGYSFRIVCRSERLPQGVTIGIFDLDNYIGQTKGKKAETIIPEPEEVQEEEARSYYYPPDSDEAQEIRNMEERFQEMVEAKKRQFGIPLFQHDNGLRELWTDETAEEVLVEARPLDVYHTVDARAVDDLLRDIQADPPRLPIQAELVDERKV